MSLTPPPGLDLDESQQANLYGAYCSTFGLAVIGVALRLITRLGISKNNLWWDDYLICFSIAVAAGNFVAMIIWIQRGLGMHIYKFGLLGLENFLMNLFVIEILYTLSIVLTKYSILAFYWRIFHNKTSIRLPIYIIATVVTCWGLGVIFTTIFQCMPVQGFWDKTINATCNVNITKFFIGNAIPNIVTDWSLLLLPLPFVWQLNRSVSQRIALYGAFAVGGFICVISIVRLFIMLNAYKIPSTDVTWVFIGPSTWTAVEVNIGVVSACLPSLRPVLKFLIPSMSTRNGYNNGKPRNWQSSLSHFSSNRHRPLTDTEIYAKPGRISEDRSDYQLNAMNVSTRVEANER